MKYFIGIIIGIILCFLCSFSYYNVSNNDSGYTKLCEYKLNGHFYVVATTGYSQGGCALLHSPNCKCNKNK